jgi:hypothetical protein
MEKLTKQEALEILGGVACLASNDKATKNINKGEGCTCTFPNGQGMINKNSSESSCCICEPVKVESAKLLWKLQN